MPRQTRKPLLARTHVVMPRGIFDEMKRNIDAAATMIGNNQMANPRGGGPLSYDGKPEVRLIEDRDDVRRR